jgi:hypothetical protein
MQASNSPADMQQQFEHQGSQKNCIAYFLSLFLFLAIQDG